MAAKSTDTSLLEALFKPDGSVRKGVDVQLFRKTMRNVKISEEKNKAKNALAKKQAKLKARMARLQTCKITHQTLTINVTTCQNCNKEFRSPGSLLNHHERQDSTQYSIATKIRDTQLPCFISIYKATANYCEHCLGQESK